MGGGGKGSQTTTTTGQNQSQTYSANPATQAAATQALTGAESAASSPFQMPVAPVAGFTPFQQQAFNQAQALQGTAQPFINQAGTFATQSGTPVTPQDINSFYNPMAANVTANLQDVFGAQNTQNTANLVQSAGGIGADRIAVGQADMAKQQGLAAGQTYANLYQQALQAAEWQKQQQGQAASGELGVGQANLNTNMAQTNLLNQLGGQQQQLSQAQLNAPYQNTLARLAYQFQTPQYLAGIAGGLAPSLGGTTQGQQFTNQVGTPPQAPLFNQIAGLGTAGVGLYGALGGSGNPAYGGGNAFTDAYGGNSATAGAYGNTAADYGAGYADGGEVDDTESIDPVVPKIPLSMGAGHSGPLTGGMAFSQPPAAPQQQQQGDSILGDIASIGKTAATILPFFLQSGGKVKGYEDGGGDTTPYVPYTWKQLGSDIMGKFQSPAAAAPINPSATWAPDSLGGRFNAAFPQMGTSAPAGGEINPNPVPAGTIPLPRPSPIDAPGSHPDLIRLDPSAKPADEEEDAPAAAPQPNVESSPNQIRAAMMPSAMQPYPDALQRDWGQQASRSPWLSLIQAGATIAATPGPLGSAIGKGLLAGTKSLDDQRKELRSEQELNNKAQELYEKASDHLDKFNKMTPYERGSLAARNREIDQSASTGGIDKAVHARALQYFKMLKQDVNNMNKPDAEILAQAYHLARGETAGAGGADMAGAGPGSTAASALPDPGAAGRQRGKWYIGPSGQPQQWIGQ